MRMSCKNQVHNYVQYISLAGNGESLQDNMTDGITTASLACTVLYMEMQTTGLSVK